MKKTLSFFIFFLIMPAAFADIKVATDQDVYNIGNRIKASASVMQDKNFEGLFKLALSCENYKLQYFLTPIALEANFRTSVDAPDLTATPSMLGNCIIAGDLVTNDNLAVEEKDSNGFSVTKQLAVLPVKTDIMALPSASIEITGVVNEAFGNNVLKASMSIGLDNNSYTFDAADGKFNLTLDVPKNIRSGKHAIEITASDSKGNAGSSSIGLSITAVPSYIRTYLSNDKLPPGSKAEIVSSVYDQSDELINDSLNLELISIGGSKIFRKAVQSNEKIDYEFSQYAEPGLYILSSTYRDLLAQDSINITTIREVKVNYENETVLVENTGNVPFVDELTFFLETESKKYPITKKIDINPGKMLNIDLSKEVPLGIYNVVLPLKEGLGTIKEKINETVQSALETIQGGSTGSLPEDSSVLASDVTIHDNRPIYKRIAGGLDSVSGALIGSDGMLAKNPVIAPVALAVVLLLIVLRYGRKPIMRLIKGRKEDDKKDDEI